MSSVGRVVLGVMVGVGLVACEETPPAGLCGGLQCAAGQRCEQDTLTCVEDLAPVVTLSAPSAVVTTETFTVSGRVLDDVEVRTVTWAFGAGAAQVLDVATDGTFTVSVAAPLVDEQAFNLAVSASDGTRTGSAQASVKVDRVGPALVLVSPDAGVTLGGPLASVAVRVDDASGALRELRIGDAGVASPGVGTVESALVPVPAGLDAQPFDVQVSATDVHGNTASTTFTLTGDVVGPAGAITQPAPGATLTSATLRVEGTSTDPSGPVTGRARLNTTAATGAFVPLSVLAGGAWSVDLPVPDGERAGVVEVELADALANVTTVSRTVQIDRVPPTIAIDAPAADSLHRQALAVTTTTGGAAVSVSVRLGSGAPVQLTGGPTSWTGTVPVPSQDYGALTLEATAADQAGNTASAQRQVFVDTVAPVVSFTAPAAGKKFNLADFTSSVAESITVSWQVQDGDAQAAVSSVNGAASSATSLAVTANPTDNGRSVGTTVTATDRAGNTGSATLTFSIDRVRPTVTSWSPAANVRNLEPRVTSITFSERVTGLTTATEALSLTPAPAMPGAWDSAHTTWTSAALTPYTVYESAMTTLADDHGNVVLQDGRKFHTAALAASSGTTPLATNVLHFRAASDPDGLVTVAYQLNSGTTGSFRVQTLSPQTLTLNGGGIVEDAPLDYAINGWNRVDPVSLTALVQFAWVSTRTNPSGPVPLHSNARYFSSVGFSPEAPVATFSTRLTVPSMSNELVVGTNAETENTTYRRYTQTITLPFSPSVHVAQSTDSAAAYRLEADRVRWTRIRCNRDRFSIPNTTFCSATEFGAPITAPSELSVAMNPGGQCLVTLFEAGGSPYGVFQALPTCDQFLGAPGCPNNTSLTPAARSFKTRVTAFHANGENTILAAWKNAGSLYLGKLTNPATCTDNFTQVGQPIAVGGLGKFEPVQLGNKAALLYVDANDALRIYVP